MERIQPSTSKVRRRALSTMALGAALATGVTTGACKGQVEVGIQGEVPVAASCALFSPSEADAANTSEQAKKAVMMAKIEEHLCQVALTAAADVIADAQTHNPDREIVITHEGKGFNVRDTKRNPNKNSRTDMTSVYAVFGKTPDGAVDAANLTYIRAVVPEANDTSITIARADSGWTTRKAVEDSVLDNTFTTTYPYAQGGPESLTQWEQSVGAAEQQVAPLEEI